MNLFTKTLLDVVDPSGGSYVGPYIPEEASILPVVAAIAVSVLVIALAAALIVRAVRKSKK